MYASEARTILGVGYSATKDEIKAAYRRLAMKHHPDRDGGSETEFKKISKAYEVLQSAGSSTSGAWAEAAEAYKAKAKGKNSDWPDFESIFSGRGYRTKEEYKKAEEDLNFYGKADRDGTRDAFGGANRQTGGAIKRSVQFSCSLEDAFKGCTKNINIENHGIHKVAVPAGTIDGQLLDVVKSNGFIFDVSIKIVAPDNVIVNWGKNSEFERGGVSIVIYVSPFLMITGGFLEVDMIDGTKVKVHIPAGSKANSLLKVKGKGYWRDTQTHYARGDCLLRMVPEIKKIDELSSGEVMDFTDAVYKQWISQFTPEGAADLLKLLVENLKLSFGLHHFEDKDDASK